MTISYSKEAASLQRFGIFWKLLFRWKGSVYKMIWPELIAFTVIYFILSFIYRNNFSEEQKILFERVALYCRAYVNAIPVTFVLGFYVSLVVRRWWNQFQSLPWPDNLAILVSKSIRGKDLKTRMMRRTIMRYANLAFTLTLKMISPQIQKRFPKYENLIEEGYLLDTEMVLLEATSDDADGNIFWVPLAWAICLVDTARQEGYIKNDLAVESVVEELNRFRGNCGGLLGYNWISIPLVYTQVVTLAVYSYILATIMGSQFIHNESNSDTAPLDMYVPIFSYLQIVFYLGWLKVAESLFNPFGTDDEDFDVNSLVDRNLRIAYLIADKMLDSHPELQQDRHWNEIFYKQALIGPPSTKIRETKAPNSELVEPLCEDKGDFRNMSQSKV